MNNIDFIYKRQSVRKFKNEDIPMDDIKEILKAATYAPSAKHIQNWHFVVVKNKEIINNMGNIVEKKHIQIAQMAKDEKTSEHFMKFLKYHTIFKNAPAVIMVFASEYPYIEADIYSENGLDEIANELLKASPAMQSIGACVENMLLAAANMGYGTCYMTGPNYSKDELAKCVGFEKDGFNLACMVPIGVAQGEIKSPPRKPVEDVMTIID